jgi:hypothetical protein
MKSGKDQLYPMRQEWLRQKQSAQQKQQQHHQHLEEPQPQHQPQQHRQSSLASAQASTLEVVDQWSSYEEHYRGVAESEAARDASIAERNYAEKRDENDRMEVLAGERWQQSRRTDTTLDSAQDDLNSYFSQKAQKEKEKEKQKHDEHQRRQREEQQIFEVEKKKRFRSPSSSQSPVKPPSSQRRRIEPTPGTSTSASASASASASTIQECEDHLLNVSLDDGAFPTVTNGDLVKFISTTGVKYTSALQKDLLLQYICQKFAVDEKDLTLSQRSALEERVKNFYITFKRKYLSSRVSRKLNILLGSTQPAN